MKSPTKERPVSFILSDSKQGDIHLTDSGLFRAIIHNRIFVAQGEKPEVTISNDIIDFDTFEQALQHLLENADENHKSQFQE